MSAIQGLAALAALLFGLILVFVLGREFLCWYWKINQRAEALDNMLVLLRAISADLRDTPTR